MSRVEEVLRTKDFREPGAPGGAPSIGLTSRARTITLADGGAWSPSRGAPSPAQLTVDLVVVDVRSGRHFSLPITVKQRAESEGRVISFGTDPSGLLDVELGVAVGTGVVTLEIKIGEMAERSVRRLLPAVRFLWRLRSPNRLGVAVSGRVPPEDQLVDLNLEEAPVADELARGFEALVRVMDFLGIQDLVAPAELSGRTREELLKADRLVSGDIVHHAWSEMTAMVERKAALELLEGPLSGEAGIDFRSPFEVVLGGRTLRIEDRWVRVHSAVVANREEALGAAGEPGDPLELRLIPGRFSGAESKLGEFPERGAAGPHEGGEADALRPYVGHWVATKGIEVIAHGTSLSGLLDEIESHHLEPDAVQWVPLRGDVEVGGLR